MKDSAPSPGSCPTCGRAIPTDAPAGACPVCLVGFAAGQSGGEAGPVLPHAFGDYELIAPIAEGACGLVYRARHRPLNRPVALKLIRSGQFATPAERRRFQLEAEAAATLDHPHIVPVYEVGEHEGWPFLAMKLLEGGSLAQRLREPARVDRGTATTNARLLATIARAVHHAHQHGILHRDLKPANVLLDQTGQPHLTDFGIAKWLRPDLTQTVGPSLLGTPQYMSPEQAAGRASEVTVASDVFSLGAMLYELVCGQPPFQGSTHTETLQRVLEANPRHPRGVNPALDGDLATIILKCLEREPARRYASAEALADDLDRWLRHEPITARPSGWLDQTRKWVWRNPVVAGLIALLSLVLAGGLTTTLWQLLRAERALTGLRQAATTAKLKLAQEWMAHGRQHEAVPLLARTVRDMPEGGSTAATLLATLTYQEFPLPVAAPTKHLAEVTAMQFAPDGRWLALASADGTVSIWDATDNRPAWAPLSHGDEVHAVTFSPDGGRLVTASLDATARIWDLRAGRPPVVIQHAGPVRMARFSPDGLRVATASDDRTARVSDGRTGEKRFELRGHTNALSDIAFSPDGALLLSVASDVRLWDARTGQAIGPPLTGPATIWQACFDPQGERILTVDREGTLRLWPINLTNFLCQWPAGTNGVQQVEFSPDGALIVTAAVDNTARFWDARTGKPVGPPLVHPRWVDFAHFSPDGTKLVTGGRDGLFRLWSVTNSTLWCAPMRGHGFAMTAAFNPDGRLLATASATGASTLWDIRSGVAQPLVLPHSNVVFRATFDDRGERVITCSADQTARVWDVKSGSRPLWSLAHTGMVQFAAFSPDRRVVLTASDDHSARIWDSQTGQPLSPPLTHTGEVRVAAFDARGARFATACTFGHVQVWDVATAGLLHRLPWPSTNRPWGAPISSLTFTPDGRSLILGGMDNTVRVWDLSATNAEVRVQHTGPVSGCALSPDGLRLAGVGWDGNAFLTELASGRPLAPPLAHDDMIFHVVFRGDGRAFATSGFDGTTRLWDGLSGRALVPPLRHGDLVYAADFSPDGNRIATASMNGSAQVWDGQTGLPIGPPLPHGGAVLTVRFSPDGLRLVTACGDGRGRIWDVAAPTQAPPAWLPALAESLVGQRITDRGVLEEVPVSEFLQWRRRLQEDHGTNAWSQWGHWFAGDRANRPGSPFTEPAR